jgi:hypothetical protein
MKHFEPLNSIIEIFNEHIFIALSECEVYLVGFTFFFKFFIFQFKIV